MTNLASTVYTAHNDAGPEDSTGSVEEKPCKGDNARTIGSDCSSEGRLAKAVVIDDYPKVRGVAAGERVGTDILRDTSGSEDYVVAGGDENSHEHAPTSEHDREVIDKVASGGGSSLMNVPPLGHDREVLESLPGQPKQEAVLNLLLNNVYSVVMDSIAKSTSMIIYIGLLYS